MSRWTPILLCDQPASPREGTNHGPDAMASYFNGWLELWHPQLLPLWEELPRVAAAGDFSEPPVDHLFVRLEDWPLGIVEDWPQRAERAGCKVVLAGLERNEFRAELGQTIGLTLDEPDPSFFGLGLGYWLLDHLAQAMGHANPLDGSTFREKLLAAAAADDGGRGVHLQAAADQLRAARDVLYPSTVHLLDIVWLDDWQSPERLPWPLQLQTPTSVALCGETLDRWQRERPTALASLRSVLESKQADLAGGPYREAADALWPIESQFTNLRRGWQAYREHLGVEPTVLARRQFGAAPQWPELASSIGIRHALLRRQGDAEVPTFKGTVLDWPNPAGKTMLTLVRTGENVADPATWFHLPRRLHETIMQDYAALLCHECGAEDSTWHRDWLALHQLAPVFGQPLILSSFFSETYANEHPPTLPADRFHAGEALPDAASLRHYESRLRMEGAAAIAGMARGLSRPANLPLALDALASRLDSLEIPTEEDVTELSTRFARHLAGRLLARTTGSQPGHCLFNTCAFARRVLVKLAGVTTPLPAPAHATQLAGESSVVSVDLPPLGFAWLPLAVAAGAKVHQPKVAIAEKHRLRNEHLEADLDVATGMITELRDSKRRIARLGVELLHQSRSRAVLHQTETTCSGPALGVIQVRGELRDDAERRLATFILDYELGWGLPYLRLRGKLTDLVGSTSSDGFAVRFSWRDPAAVLHRLVGWSKEPTQRALFESPGFLEVAAGQARTQILCGGLFAWQRHGARAVDLRLSVGNATDLAFEVALAIDQPEPLLSVQDWLTPAIAVPVDKGPPPGGPIGWLFDLDSSHLMITSLQPTFDGSDAVVLRVVECRGISGEAQLRCPRHPVCAEVIDDRGEHVAPLTTVDDTVFLHLAGHEAMRLRLAFTA